jgi:hypothetical protein
MSDNASAAPGQVYRAIEGTPRDLDAFAQALFLERPCRGRSWPGREGGRVEFRCDTATCAVSTVRVELHPVGVTPRKAPEVTCPVCGHGLRLTRRLETVAMVPVAEAGALPG